MHTRSILSLTSVHFLSLKKSGTLQNGMEGKKMNCWKPISAFCICAALCLSGCSGSSSSSQQASAAPEASAIAESKPGTGNPAAGTYRILGVVLPENCVVSSNELTGYYLTLDPDGKGQLFFGENNQGPISSWSVDGTSFQMKAGISDFTGKLDKGIMNLDLGDDYVLVFATDAADTSGLKTMTMEEYKSSLADSAPAGAADAAMAGEYIIYAVESTGRCVQIPEEDRNALAFILNPDGTGKVRVENESEDLTWRSSGNRLLLYELTGKAIDTYEITVEKGIMRLIVKGTDGEQDIIEYLVTKDADVSSIQITDKP